MLRWRPLHIYSGNNMLTFDKCVIPKLRSGIFKYHDAWIGLGHLYWLTDWRANYGGRIFMASWGIFFSGTISLQFAVAWVLWHLRVQIHQSSSKRTVASWSPTNSEEMYHTGRSESYSWSKGRKSNTISLEYMRSDSEPRARQCQWPHCLQVQVGAG